MHSNATNDYFLRKTFVASNPAGSRIVVHSSPEITADRSIAPIKNVGYKIDLYVTPLKSNGTVCQDPWIVSTGSQVLVSTVVHSKVALYLNKPIPTASGCTRRFAIKTRIFWLSGSRLLVENSQYSNTVAWTADGSS